jgi:hypothetical protein
MKKNKLSKRNIPIISEETIKKHIENIKKSIEKGDFKTDSNRVIEMILKENPELAQKIILPTLESEKPEEFKKGYLAGVATIYDLLKMQVNK